MASICPKVLGGDRQFRALEKALVSNDVAVLDELFRDDPARCATGFGRKSLGLYAITAFRRALAGGADAQDRADGDHKLMAATTR